MKRPTADMFFDTRYCPTCGDVTQDRGNEQYWCLGDDSHEFTQNDANERLRVVWQQVTANEGRPLGSVPVKLEGVVSWLKQFGYIDNLGRITDKGRAEARNWA